MIQQPCGVVFDMDGLLLDSERLYFKAYRDTRAALGLASDDALFLSIVGTNHALGREMLERGLSGHVSLSTFEDHWATTCATHTAAGIPVKPGVTALLEQLQSQATPYAIATSTYTKRAWGHLKNANLDTHFETLIGGDQVSKSKPAPDIYLAATTALGLAPAECVAFEDSENGVRAAVAADLRTVQIPDLIAPSDALRQLGHAVAPDLMTGAREIGLIT